MKRQRRTHSLEFKKEAVALVVEQGCSYAEAGRSLGVSAALIGGWKRQLEDNASEAFQGKGKRTAEQQRIHELEQENRRLKMEKEIFKKETVGSTDQRNAFLKFIRWSLITQRFSWSLIKPSGYLV